MLISLGANFQKVHRGANLESGANLLAPASMCVQDCSTSYFDVWSWPMRKILCHQMLPWRLSPVPGLTRKKQYQRSGWSASPSIRTRINIFRKVTHIGQGGRSHTKLELSVLGFFWKLRSTHKNMNWECGPVLSPLPMDAASGKIKQCARSVFDCLPSLFIWPSAVAVVRRRSPQGPVLMLPLGNWSGHTDKHWGPGPPRPSWQHPWKQTSASPMQEAAWAPEQARRPTIQESAWAGYSSF